MKKKISVTEIKGNKPFYEVTGCLSDLSILSTFITWTFIIHLLPSVVGFRGKPRNTKTRIYDTQLRIKKNIQVYFIEKG